MRGFKKDPAETKAAYACGALIDRHKRSFVGRKPGGTLHLMLYGEDKVRMHDKIMAKAAGKCQGCDQPHYCGAWLEWHHINHKPWNRCDCEANGMGVCSGYHSRLHLLRFRVLVAPCPGVPSFVGKMVAA